MPTLTDSATPDRTTPEPAIDAPPEAELGQSEDNAELQKLLGQLSANKQEVIRLKFQEGMSYRQISDVTGLTVSNVGYLLHTALAELRAEMEREA
jgi:RNA polymerase sigma-70 factor (ECF subfamily)